MTTDREQEMALTTSATNWGGDNYKNNCNNNNNNCLKDYVLFSFIASY
jgi:hypothetical protein